MAYGKQVLKLFPVDILLWGLSFSHPILWDNLISYYVAVLILGVYICVSVWMCVYHFFSNIKIVI